MEDRSTWGPKSPAFSTPAAPKPRPSWQISKDIEEAKQELISLVGHIPAHANPASFLNAEARQRVNAVKAKIRDLRAKHAEALAREEGK
jgi:hypothetical protein